MNTVETPIQKLPEKKEKLVADFLQGRGRDFLHQHSDILDEYFLESFASSSVGPAMRIDKNPCAIIALGGYGRREQYLYSDVDVLILFKKKVPDEAKGLVQEILYPLWDIGLDVGYATRSLKECCGLAARDFEVLTSLMDGRFLCGISSLYSELMDRLHGKVLRRHRRAYTRWLSAQNRDRHARFGDSTYLLEPNVKEGMGGLRDYHAMLWLGKATYDMKEPRDLEFLGHLSHDEYKAMEAALDFVRTVRNWLHHLSSRRCDQLYFEYQMKLAGAMGFSRGNGQQAVERFLGELHGQMEFLKRHHRMFLAKALEEKGKGAKRKTVHRGLSTGIEIAHDAIAFESPEAIVANPYILIRIFEHSTRLGLPLSEEAKRLVREFLFLVDDELRGSSRVVKSFRQILSAPPMTFNVLNEMLGTGMLVALIPELKGIVNRIQYDEYHVYPVDKHSLRTLQTVKGFREARGDSPDAFYGGLFREVVNPELLLWACLLHDVGKGSPGPGHAGRGAKLVQPLLRRMGHSESDVETVSFLIRQHLLLVEVATRRDINDEKIVVQCARRLPDSQNLKMLFLLTVADCRATGPKAWSRWTASLLKELFFKLDNVLEKGELATPAAAEVVAKKRATVLGWSLPFPREEAEGLFEQMSSRYLLYTPAEDIERHLTIYRSLGGKPFVLEAQAGTEQSYRTVTICARDFPGLFSKIAGVMTLNNLDIVGAQIYTWRNRIALDIFEVKAPADRVMENQLWDRVRKDLGATLEGRLALDRALGEKLKAYRRSQKALSKRPDKVVIDTESSDFFTIVEVYTHDFTGLLYRITDALYRCGLDIRVAKIATKVDQVVDVFYVRDFDGQKVDRPEAVESIRAAIEATLGHGRPVDVA